MLVISAMLGRVRWSGCVAVAAILLVSAANAAGSERHALAYDLGAADASYVKRYRVEVGDVRHHTLEVFVRKRIFTRNAPAFAGVRASEAHEHGVADLVDQSGTESAYVTFLMEDGSRALGRYEGTIESRRWPDGSRHYDVRGTIELTGGNERFVHLRGRVRLWQAIDPGADSSQGGAEGEYWFAR
jgi:hypothetical protein